MVRLERKHFYIFCLFLTFIAGSIFTTLIIQVFAHGGDTNLIHACVRNNLPNLPNIRIVGANTNCGPNETALDWIKQSTPDNLPFICTGCDLSASNQTVESADLISAILTNSNLSTDDFEDKNFTNAKLTYGSLEYSNLTNANFTGADLRFTALGSADATGANLTNTNLEGATGMDSTTLTSVNWNNTTCPDGTDSDDNSNTCEGHLTP